MNVEKTEALRRLEEIITKVSGVTVEEIHSKSRDKEVCEARHAVWLIAKMEFNYPYKYLSKVYGKDRTTIMHGISRLRQSDHYAKVVAGVKKIDPTITLRARRQKTIGIDSWEFLRPGEKLGTATGDSDVEK